MYQIVCYGDSNTWGYIPGNGARFDENTRWTGRLQKLLGDEYNIVEEGISARTTSFDDPYRDYLNGRTGLPYALMAAKPIDLLIISLGTNDLKLTNVYESAKGIGALLNMAVNADAFVNAVTMGPVYKDGPKILVISPIHVDPAIDTDFPGSAFCGKVEDSRRFAELYKAACEQYHVEFMDAAEIAAPSKADCIHMDAENHRLLAEAVAKKVTEMLGE